MTINWESFYLNIRHDQNIEISEYGNLLYTILEKGIIRIPLDLFYIWPDVLALLVSVPLAFKHKKSPTANGFDDDRQRSSLPKHRKEDIINMDHIPRSMRLLKVTFAMDGVSSIKMYYLLLPDCALL
jgi:hypothetical protein